ncbi:hypothetical protein GCM10009127_23730 [Alteraurantiacibacter aestuarii]|uniref:DUF6152 family protein n=1 Tax=Alteraurantiacibacter aestuarii TaxID=650004 RepID=UPI0031DAC183
MSRFASTASILAAVILGLAIPGKIAAHHSFAVFFDETRTVAIEGRVTAFRFTNPHGTIALDVTAADGTVQHWRVETNAPVVLQRRGWTRSSLHAGDIVRIDGWPSRDGKPYLRLRSATMPDGRAVGQAFGVGED